MTASLAVVTPAGCHPVLRRGHSLAAITARALEEFPAGATVERTTLAGLVLAHAAGLTVPPVLLRQAKRFADAALRKEAATSAAAAARREAAHARVVANKAAARAAREAVKAAEKVAKAAATRALARQLAARQASAAEVAALLLLVENLPGNSLPANSAGDLSAPWD